MDPTRIVVSSHNQFFDPDQTRRVLPATRLSENVKTTDVPANQTAISKSGGLPVDRFNVAFWHRSIFADHVDVRFLLDESFGDPGRILVRLEYHRQLALGCDETKSGRGIGLIGNLFGKHSPLTGGDAAGFEKAQSTLLRVEILAGRFVARVCHDPVDGIQSKTVEKLTTRCATQVLPQEVVHDMVRCDR